MKRKILILPLCTFVLCSPMPPSPATPPTGVMRTPEQIKWVDNPRVPGLGLAKIVGDAKKPGPFVHRVKFPPGRVVQAHSHPDDRTYTVLSGTWYIGWGKPTTPRSSRRCPPVAFTPNRRESRTLSPRQTARRSCK